MRAEIEAKKIKRNLIKYFEEMDQIKYEWEIQDKIDAACRKIELELADKKAELADKDAELQRLRALLESGKPLEEIINQLKTK